MMSFTKIRILLTGFLLVCCITPSWADLGLTKKEAIEKFGQPVQISDPTDLSGDWAMYIKGAWKVLLIFNEEGKSKLCTYKIGDEKMEMPEDAIKGLLERNQHITGGLSEVKFPVVAVELGLRKSGLPEQEKESIKEIPDRTRIWVNMTQTYCGFYDRKNKIFGLFENH